MNILKPRTAEPNHRFGETFWSPVWHHVQVQQTEDSPISVRNHRFATQKVQWCTGPLFYGDQRTEGLFYFPRCWLQIGLLWCLYTISYIEAACSFVLWILTAKRISQIVTPRTLLNGHVKPKLRTIHLRHVPHAWASQYKMITYVVIYINVLIYNI